MAMRGASNGSLLIPLLCSRKRPLEAAYEIQARRGVAEDFLVVLVERVAQMAIGSQAVAQQVIQVDSQVGISRVLEQATGGAESGFDIQYGTAEIARHIGGDPPVAVGRRES